MHVSAIVAHGPDFTTFVSILRSGSERAHMNDVIGSTPKKGGHIASWTRRQPRTANSVGLNPSSLTQNHYTLGPVTQPLWASLPSSGRRDLEDLLFILMIKF